MDLPSFDSPPRVPHRRKEIYQYLNGNWSEQELMRCIELRRTSHLPYRDIIQNTNISLSTFFTKVKSLSRGGIAKPERGPKRKLTVAEESQMAEYLNECWELGVPKTRDNFALDIVNYLQCFKVTNTFPNRIPGKGWFARFEAENPSVKFMTRTKLIEYLKDDISLGYWIVERDKYIYNQALGTKCWTRDVIFLAEVETLRCHADSEFAFNTVLCYNAQGVYCQPLVIHDGRISQNVVQQYSDKMDFIQTVHGALSFNCVGRCVRYVNEYLKLFNLDYPALLYLSPNFAEMLSFASWEFSKQSNVIIQIIPQSIWRNLTSAHLGVFRKIHPRFQQIAFRKVLKWHIEMTHALFMECIFQLVKSGPFTPHLHAGFATLKLLALESQTELRKRAEEEQRIQMEMDRYVEHHHYNMTLHEMFRNFSHSN